MVRFIGTVLLAFILIGFAGCESARSVFSKPAKEKSAEKKTEVVENATTSEEVEAVETTEVSSALAAEAAEKYRLALQLLDFAGPIDDPSLESKNVRWLAADLLTTAIELDPTEFQYYRDLFMTYMVLQEPVRALEALEPARGTPAMAGEVAEFQSLVFGAMEFVSTVDPED